MTWWIGVITLLFVGINLALVVVAIERRWRRGRHFRAVDRRLAVWQTRLEPWLTGVHEREPEPGKTALDREAIDRILLPRLDSLPLVKRDQVLTYLIESGAVGYRLRGLRDRHWWVRAQAASALGQLRVTEAREDLERVMGDPQVEVRQAAIRALGQLGDVRSLEVLLHEAHMGVTDCREYLIGALRAMGPAAHAPLLHTLGMPGKTEAHLIALRVLQDVPEEQVVTAIAQVVQQTGDEEMLMAALEGLAKIGGIHPTACLAACRRALGHQQPAIRAAAVRVLGFWRLADGLDDLEHALHDSDWFVRRSAARALNALGQVAYPALERGLSDPLSQDVVCEEAQIAKLFPRLLKELEDPASFKPAYRLVAALLGVCGDLGGVSEASIKPETLALIRELLPVEVA